MNMSTLAGQANYRPWRTAFGYAAMLLATVLGFFIIRHFGEALQTSATLRTVATQTAAVAHRNDTLLHVLLALVAMIVVGRLLGLAFRRVGQPPVIGEVVAGILLGPSLLGLIAPDFAS